GGALPHCAAAKPRQTNLPLAQATSVAFAGRPPTVPKIPLPASAPSLPDFLFFVRSSTHQLCRLAVGPVRRRVFHPAAGAKPPRKDASPRAQNSRPLPRATP